MSELLRYLGESFKRAGAVDDGKQHLSLDDEPPVDAGDPGDPSGVAFAAKVKERQEIAAKETEIAEDLRAFVIESLKKYKKEGKFYQSLEKLIKTGEVAGNFGMGFQIRDTLVMINLRSKNPNKIIKLALYSVSDLEFYGLDQIDEVKKRLDEFCKNY